MGDVQGEALPVAIVTFKIWTLKHKGVLFSQIVKNSTISKQFSEKMHDYE